MSTGPDKVPIVVDLFSGTGTGITSTGAGSTFIFPAGKKAIQVNMTATSTITIKIQNSIDGTNWFDVSSSTAVAENFLSEIDSVVPKWRVHVSAFAAIGAGTQVASIAHIVP